MKKIVILAIVAVLSLGVLTACGGGGATHKLQVVAGENGEMKYNPDVLTGVKKGEKVEVTLVNKDSAQAHSFILPKFNVKSKQVQPGQQEVITFTASATGDFEFNCDVPGHKDGGMIGKLTVGE